MRIKMLKQVAWAFDHIHPTVLYEGHEYTVGVEGMTEEVANALLADLSAVTVSEGERGTSVGKEAQPPEASPPRRQQSRPVKK